MRRVCFRGNSVEKLHFHRGPDNFRAAQEQLQFLAEGGSQKQPPAMWNSLIERSGQSNLISMKFAVFAENLEPSDFEFFNIG
jgi:hypothetical protein